ncbi:MAG TPA: hypothetical protein VET82_06235 [Candidatus Eisenbacteria bacterium]|nr:hypothetical protein [Candidatus Eisenbacteria bacterium]
MAEFEVTFDDEALRWLGERPSGDPLVIAYEDSRCCGGGHIRDLRVRGSRRREEESEGLVGVGEVDGRRILLDRRIMPRMPRRIPVTVRGLGPFRSLHLDFSGEEWARLLYEIV